MKNQTKESIFSLSMRLSQEETKALRAVLLGHLSMKMYCEMADENADEQVKYAICEKVIKEIEKK